MADTAAVEYDWSGITAETTTRLRAPKVVHVPEPIVALAQRSFDEKTALRYRFKSEKEAEAFAGHLKQAGKHTKPLTSVTVKIDPDRQKDGPPVDPRVVAWKSGQRRGHGQVS